MTTATTDRPTTLQDFPELMEKQREMESLSMRRTELENSERKLAMQFCQKYQNRVPGSERVREQDREVAALLGRPTAKSEAAEMQERLQTFRSELATVTAACEVVSGAYSGLQRRASMEICRSLAGEHRALAVGRAALRLIDAAQAEEAFRDNLVRQGVKVCHPIVPAVWKTWGNLRESIVGHFLKELDQQIPGTLDEVMNDHADD